MTKKSQVTGGCTQAAWPRQPATYDCDHPRSIKSRNLWFVSDQTRVTESLALALATVHQNLLAERRQPSIHVLGLSLFRLAEGLLLQLAEDEAQHGAAARLVEAVSS